MQLSAIVLARPGSGTGNNNGDGTSNPWIFWLVAAVILVAGVVTLVKPDLVWRMNRWQYKDKNALEPSRAGLIAQRASGGLMVGFAIFFAIFAATR